MAAKAVSKADFTQRVVGGGCSGRALGLIHKDALAGQQTSDFSLWGGKPSARRPHLPKRLATGSYLGLEALQHGSHHLSDSLKKR